MKKRILSILVALAMACTVLPVAVFAQDTPTPPPATVEASETATTPPPATTEDSETTTTPPLPTTLSATPRALIEGTGYSYDPDTTTLTIFSDIGTTAWLNNDNINTSDVTKVEIKEGVTTTGVGTFSDCTSLESVDIPASVTTIGENAFNSCKSLASVTIPSSVTTIDDQAFQNCTKLDSVTFADDSELDTIGNGAFHGCESLTNMTIPSNVTTIDINAFYGCTSLTSVIFPSGVTTIEMNAFNGCTSLASVTFEGATPPTFGISVFASTASTLKIYVPVGSDQAYKNVSNLATWQAKIETAPVAKIGSVGYSTLQAAIGAVTVGQTIQLQTNITEKVTIASGRPAFTLDLNGKTLDGSATASAITHNGTGKLTIKDTGSNGKITSAFSDDATISLTARAATDTVLEITGGTIENTSLSVTSSAITNMSAGTVSISGGTVTGKGFAIGNGGAGKLIISNNAIVNTTSSSSAAIINQGTGNVSVTGGKVSSTTAIAIHNDKTGTVSVSGGEVSATASVAIGNMSTGKITVSGGKVTSANVNLGTIYLNAGATTDTVLEITGGTIENTNASGIAVKNDASGKILIPSGTSIIKGGDKAMNVAPDLTGYDNVKITASTNVNGSNPVTYVPADIATYKYLAFSSSAPVAKIGSVGYSTLQAAIGAVTVGQTIQLQTGITENVTIASGRPAFTLDLNGNKLDGGAASAITHNGTGKLTIKDTGSNGKITSAFSDDATISLTAGAATDTVLEITGGTIENTSLSENSLAIANMSAGTVSISGGTVTCKGFAIGNGGAGKLIISNNAIVNTTGSNGAAIINQDTGNVSVTGGEVSATNIGVAIYNESTGKITVSGGKVTSANTVAGTIYLRAGAETDTVLEITGGTIENTAANGIAVKNDASGKILIPSGTSIIKGGDKAMDKAPDLTGYDNVKITASTNADGSTPVEYVPADIATYKYLKFEPIGGNNNNPAPPPSYNYNPPASTAPSEVTIDSIVTQNDKTSLVQAVIPRESGIYNPIITAREIALPAIQASAITKAIPDYYPVRTLDISMFDGTTSVSSIASGFIEITMPFKGVEGDEYMVLRIENNGAITALDAKYSNGKITFKTNHFSTYVVVKKGINQDKPTGGKTEVPQTSIKVLEKLF